MAKAKIETRKFTCPNNINKLKEVREAISNENLTISSERRVGGNILFEVRGPKMGIKNLGKDLKRIGGIKA